MSFYSLFFLLVLDFIFIYPSYAQTETTFPEQLNTFINQPYFLPRYTEKGYSPLGRSPVVDAVLEDPFYLPMYAQVVSQQLKNVARHTSLYEMSSISFRAGGMPLSNEITFTYPYLNSFIPEKFSQTFNNEQGPLIYSLWQAFIQVYQESRKILSVLSPTEKQWLQQNYRAFFFGNQNKREYDFFTTESPMPFKFFEMASRIDLVQLTHCARKLALLVDVVYKNRAQLELLKLDQDFIWEEQGMKLIISHRYQAVYKENADFFLDLGGNNTFYTNAGGTEGIRPAALHIGLHGNNHFIGQNFVQGSGFLGVGVLAHFEGNNIYQANAYAQGCGFFGAGLLMDLEGHNHYEIDFFGQSSALFGPALLWNPAGNSQYLAHKGMAQAASSTLGVAFLVDNQGNSDYICGHSSPEGEENDYNGIGQGASVGVRYSPWLNHPSLYGGLSFLYTGAGKNYYSTSWFGQGSAYFLGAGILVNEGKEANFYAEVDSQGQALHLAAGLLLQKGSRHSFEGGWGSLGVGADRSVGMFINTGGESFYKGKGQSVGTARKPQALGVFINLKGNNSYTFQEESNANIQWPTSPSEWPTALFLTLGGNNLYSQNVDSMQRGTNRLWGIKNHSLGIDQENVTDHLFNKFLDQLPLWPRVAFPFDPINGWPSNIAYFPLKKAANLEELRNQVQQILTASYEQRRYLYECIDLFRFSYPTIEIDLSDLLAHPAYIPADQFNYGVLWALQSRKKAHLEEIIEALNHQWIASDYAREMGIALIGQLGEDSVASVLNHLMLTDPFEKNRALAAYYLGQIPTLEALQKLEPGLRSESVQVRYAAATALRNTPLTQALNLITSLFHDRSFYVRRAAALTAISLKDKRGIPVLLKTLKFPTLDTTDNYGDNLYNDLAKYVGVNFGLDNQAWLDWWEKVKNNFTFPKKPNKKKEQTKFNVPYKNKVARDN